MVVALVAAEGAPEGVASMIDHTLLKPDATRAEIEHPRIGEDVVHDAHPRFAYAIARGTHRTALGRVDTTAAPFS